MLSNIQETLANIEQMLGNITGKYRDKCATCRVVGLLIQGSMSATQGSVSLINGSVIDFMVIPMEELVIVWGILYVWGMGKKNKRG